MAGSPFDTSDPAMMELFRAEVETHSQTLSAGLLALEQAPGEVDRIKELMRAAHSIKGAARIVGVDTAAEVAHGMEDVLVAAQEGQLTLHTAAIDVLLRGLDAVQQISAHLDRPPADWRRENAPLLDRLLADLAAVRAGNLPAAPALLPPGPAVAEYRPAGNLDRGEAERLRQELSRRVDAGERELEIDFGAVTDLEPPALGLMAFFLRPGTAALRLLKPRPEVAVLLRGLGLGGLLAETAGR